MELLLLKYSIVTVLLLTLCNPITFGYNIEKVSEGGTPHSLGLCQGDCDSDDDCMEGFYCFQRSKDEAIPGCQGGEEDSSRTDYCVPVPPVGPPVSANDSTPSAFNPNKPSFPVLPPTIYDPPLVFFGGNPPSSVRPLRRCEGDCDSDSDCGGDLLCFQRDPGEVVPGCAGIDNSRNDYCIHPGHASPMTLEFTPGKLTVRKLGLLLSEGLDARLIATSGRLVTYVDGKHSNHVFHHRPDGGATFRDEREHNPGGWIYVSNSEMQRAGDGGVGALTFDSSGNVIDYRMILNQTTMNCGGGRTPWDTWASCEEVKGGKVFQVDPTGERDAEVMTLGNSGGRWESFAFDVRNQAVPRFFVTEDDPAGALCRFTPHQPDWDNPWDMLHREGIIDYLVLTVDNTGDRGEFEWTTDRMKARQSAEDYYPQSEGIDVNDSQLYFVCKRVKMMYTLNLDVGTWSRASTMSGLFDGQPDQMQRLLGDSRSLLYFTEDGGTDAGIHARDKDARFYTIMESTEYPGETTGLSFSPDGIYMYLAYQDIGKLFCLFRRDGKPFDFEHLDIKYHASYRG